MSTKDISHHLERFTEAQDGVFDVALTEIRRGRKESHWMWFIFPQLQGLGLSSLSHFYGIRSLAEAKEYVNHPLLGKRLRTITSALLQHQNTPAEAIFGPIDALKLKSCMTLFDLVSPDDIFQQTLKSFFGGQADTKTLSLLAKEKGRSF